VENEVFWKKDDTSFPVEYTSTPIRDERGDLLGAVVVFEDIAERKQLEAQLRRAQRMEAVGRSAGGVAHDFNNLLMVIKGYSDLMLDRLSPGEPFRKNADEIKKAADRAASLTRQLLAFSRMQVLQPKVLDLNAVVAEMGKMLPRLIREDIELTIVTKASLGRVRADQSQIEQVILNLVVNARDAMPQGGKLTIETANVDLDVGYARRHAGVSPGSYVMLAVSDTGVGMDAETQAHIFEPFFTTKGLGKGTGLGLATVYGVVKQSGGWIWVYSELGRGATLKIYLPRVEEVAEEVELSKTVAAPPRGSETILLVEDQDSIRELARQFLEGSGYTVLEARDGSDALEIAERQQGVIDLLVTDVVMPKMGGPELAYCLSTSRPQLRVLYMSGYAEHAGANDHGMAGGDTASLQKPFALDTLARKVREVLDAKPVVRVPSK
jgi:signal transduction histidine kinase/CheY-like chemotaxis protein